MGEKFIIVFRNGRKNKREGEREREMPANLRFVVDGPELTQWTVGDGAMDSAIGAYE